MVVITIDNGCYRFVAEETKICDIVTRIDKKLHFAGGLLKNEWAILSSGGILANGIVSVCFDRWWRK